MFSLTKMGDFCRVSLGPAEKINITVPRLVLARIDEFAKKKGQSRSGFLVEAARTAMHA